MTGNGCYLRSVPERIAARVDRLLAAAAFQNYARAAQVAGCERALFATYVAYMARVIRPA